MPIAATLHIIVMVNLFTYLKINGGILNSLF